MRLLIFILFTLLLTGAFAFSQERILFSDASFICSEIVNTGSLRIQENRFGSFITQLFPLLAGKAHLPLSAIVILYSLSFNLFYLAVVAALLFLFKNTRLAVLMAFYYTLIVSDTYFWTNNEVHQAIAWMFLLFGIILHYKKRNYPFYIHVLLFGLLAFLSLFTHPLVLLILPFLWLFYLLDKDNNPYSGKEMFLLSGLIVLIASVKFMLMKQSSYDMDRINSATHVNLADVIGSFTSPLAKIMAGKLVTHYYFVIILFSAGAVAALKMKKYKQLALTLLFSAGYFAVMCLTFHNFQAFYTESEWMPFTIITTILFVYYVLPRIKPSLAVSLLTLIFVVRSGYIFQASAKFVQRKEWIYATLDKMEKQGISKGYLYNNEQTDRILIMNWGLPTESLIASALKGYHPAKTFVMDSPEGIAKRKVQNKDMIASFGPWSYAFLHHYYFSIDTTVNYCLIREL